MTVVRCSHYCAQNTVMVFHFTQYKSKSIMTSSNHSLPSPFLLPNPLPFSRCPFLSNLSPSILPFALLLQLHWQPHCSSNKSVTFPCYSLHFSFSFCLECSFLVIHIWLLTSTILMSPTWTILFKSTNVPTPTVPQDS